MRQRVFITAALLAFLAFGISRIAVINGFIEMDEVVHYLQARYAPHHPFLYASIWARPLFVLLYTPACQFPFDVARGFTLLMAAFAGYLAYRESDRKGIPWPALAFALTVAQPLYIKQSYTVMTEHTLALLLIASLHFWETDRRDLSCFLMSLTPLSRPEGFFLGPLWFLLVILDRNAAVRDRLRRSSILLTGLLLWALISRLFCGTPLWFVQNFPWVHHGSAHNATLWDFPARLPQFASLPVIALAMIGLVTIRRYKLQMASLLSFFLIPIDYLYQKIKNNQFY